MDALQRVDLNLLVTFDVLARTGSVTRAAQHLGVTQSAVSHALRRLRAELDDPLLVRAGGGMALTARAEALQVPLRAALVAVGRALAPARFDPATARRHFRLTSPDLFDLLVLPALVARVAAEAPGVDLTVVPRPPPYDAALDAGELDLAVVPVGVLAEEPGPALVRRTVLGGTYRCYLRRAHPALERPLDLDAYVALPHLLVSPTGAGAGLVDRLLAGVGRQRRVALRVPTFAVAAQVAARTDLVLTAPDSLARA
ncbi:MAG: LysR family transcriptional regulator, partial [Myxococcota bacterium]